MIKRLMVFLKGMAMGAADVVPGVSGGTIAFITGIYDDLLASINAINLQTLKQLKTDGIKSVWQTINGNFLVALFAGISLSVISLAKIILELRLSHPNLVWAFFFGLVVGSIYLVYNYIVKWEFLTYASVLVGTVVCFLLTEVKPSQYIDSPLYLVLGGAIAICAMILPGVSGAFLLLILGLYDYIFESISSIKDALFSLVLPSLDDMKIIFYVGLGAIVGLLSFSRLLKWFLEKHNQKTIAVLLGFLIGSLNKLWPWKHTVSTRLNSHNIEVPFIQENVLPSEVAEPQIAFVAILLVIGIAVIVVMSRFAPKELDD